jgi:Ca2+-transporting ATPase
VQLLWVNLVTDGPPATALGFNPPSPDSMMKQPRSRSEPLLTSWLLVRYGVTGLYVGAATIGIMVWWFSDHGVGLNAAAVLAEVTKGARAPLHGVFGRRERGGTAAPAGKTAPVTSLLTWTQCKEWASFAPRGCDLVHLGVADAKGGIADPCALFTGRAQAKVQTMALSVLVCSELLKALSAVSIDASLLTMPPFRNPLLLIAVAASFGIHFGVLHSPWLAPLFGLTSLTVREWGMVAAFSFPVLLVEEVLKWIGREREEGRWGKREGGREREGGKEGGK